MDVVAKRRGAERVRRLLGKKLRPLGFVRGKTSFWARPQGHVIEFLHLHLFTFTPAFRAHAGIRVVNDTSAAAALNGPTSDGSWSGTRGHYSLEFADSEQSQESCATEIARFCSEIAEPWFERHRESTVLLTADSVLTESARASLDRALRGFTDPEAAQLSRELLGVA
ncbi:MAG TPA: hypothetical protein VMD49_11515 [Steroidobacteraceae bacterium]|nr:hypothetical protein [Steroidobacteraceae bacterium]